MPLDPHFKAMLDAQAAAAPAETPPLEAIPPAMIRAGYRMQRTGQNTRVPQDVETRDLQVAGAAGPIAARLYTPAGAASPGPGLVYFHGGGFVIGDLETHDGHCRRLASFSGVRVMAVDYRLAPEFPFPAGHDDALAATKWAFDHAGEIGFDKTRIAVGGDSAGGNLAAVVSIDLRGDAAHPIKYQLLLYPGLWPEKDTRTRQERDGPVLSKAAIAYFDKSLAAIGHPNGVRAFPPQQKDLSGLPPALVVTAGFDPLEDEGKDYAAALTAAGGKAEVLHYESLVHDFFIMGDVSPAVEAAARDAAAKLKAALA
jgi:acetyl esterase